MPPRIPLYPSLLTRNGAILFSRTERHAIDLDKATPSHTIALPIRPFSATTSFQKKPLTRLQQRRKQDKWVRAQHEARVAVNRSRQVALKKERAIAAGDPVKGITTAFLKSFDTARDDPNAGSPFYQAAFTNVLYNAIKGTTSPEATESEAADASTAPKVEPAPMPEEFLAFCLRAKAIANRLQKSFKLTLPVVDEQSIQRNRRSQALLSADQIKDMTAGSFRTHQAEHNNAAAAIARIVNLANASSRGRSKVNVQRCVAEFGRHNTDLYMEPKPIGLPTMGRYVQDPGQWVIERTAEAEALRERNGPQQRGGPDTGSSEVQIAILTANIRALQHGLETTANNQDKQGKNSLRLLVHRRQKLLKYLWRKERGGPRWQHCVDKLGLTDGTWKGEISI